MIKKLQKKTREYNSFSLDKTENHILEHIGKNGPLNKNQVGKGISNRSPYKKVKQIGRDIEKLKKKGFLHITKSRKIRNLKRKEKLFGLTFKGFLAIFEKIKLEDNYLFQKYLLLLNEDSNKSVTKFIRLYIKEFLLYHKGIGFRLDDVNDLSNYIRRIFYDHSSIKYDSNSQKELKNIKNNEGVIDEIRDAVQDIETYDHVDVDNDRLYEFEKYEFLINFWPNVIENLSENKDMKKDILKLEQDQSPVNLEHSTEDIDREIKQKGIDMHYQWRKRKLNFQKLPHT
jgi:hypothetical protein